MPTDTLDPTEYAPRPRFSGQDWPNLCRAPDTMPDSYLEEWYEREWSCYPRPGHECLHHGRPLWEEMCRLCTAKYRGEKIPPPWHKKGAAELELERIRCRNAARRDARRGERDWQNARAGRGLPNSR